MTNLKVCRVEARAHTHTPKLSVLQINTRVPSNNSVFFFFLIYFWVRIAALWYAETKHDEDVDEDEDDGDDNIGCDGLNSRFVRQYLPSNDLQTVQQAEQRNRTMDMVCNCNSTTNDQNHELEVIFLYYNWNCSSNSLIRSQELSSGALLSSAHSCFRTFELINRQDFPHLHQSHATTVQN